MGARVGEAERARDREQRAGHQPLRALAHRATTRSFDTGGTRHWPAGASGPFSAKVKVWPRSTKYSFRICGRDDSPRRGPVAPRPVRSRPKGHAGLRDGWLGRAAFLWGHRARWGQWPEPRAQCSFRRARRFRLGVQGLRHLSGGAGIRPPSGGRAGAPSTASPHPATDVVTVVDNGPPGTDTLGFEPRPGSTPPDCAAASFANQVPSGLRQRTGSSSTTPPENEKPTTWSALA